MSPLETESAGAASVFELPPVLDLSIARDLSQRLLEALSSSGRLIIDAGNVQRFTTPCLQVLTSAALPDPAGIRAVTVCNLPEAMSEAIALLGLSMALAEEGEA